jgi:hypothetical protein
MKRFIKLADDLSNEIASSAEKPLRNDGIGDEKENLSTLNLPTERFLLNNSQSADKHRLMLYHHDYR